jgi:hypothetical protein
MYPTLFDDPEQIRISREQCDFPGAMFSLDLRGGKPRRSSFCAICVWRAMRYRWAGSRRWCATQDHHAFGFTKSSLPKRE